MGTILGPLADTAAAKRRWHEADGFVRQCVGNRCGRDRPLVPSRGQALDHVAFSVERVDALVARLRRANVKVLEGPYAFGDTKAYMIEDPDGLSIELIERRP